MPVVSIVSWIETVSNVLVENNEENKEIRHNTEYVVHRMCVGSIFS